MAGALAVCTTALAAAHAQPTCHFALGFAQLHSLIPDIVGDCLDDEMHDPTTGDALQLTTHGLLVWRKADNFTAFTDGSQTWVNGPFGVQQRSNDQRFFWEANPAALPIVPPPQPGERCHTAGLSLSVVGVDAGAGNLVGTFRFTNSLNVPCTFFGFPGAQLLDAANNPLPTVVVRSGGPFTNAPPPATVTVAPHGAAVVRIHWEQVPVGNEPTCPIASSIAITPPDEFAPLIVATQIRACGGGHLDVTPVLPDASA